MVFIKTTIFLLLSVSSALSTEDRFILPDTTALTNGLQLLSGLSGASNNNGSFPFELIPQFLPSIIGLLTNISQAYNNTQQGQTAGGERQLATSIPPKPVYTTLPFNDLNATEFSWLWGNISQLTESQTNTNAPQPKLFGNAGANATLADLNFYSLPQLFTMLGR